MNKKYHLLTSLTMFALTFFISFVNNTWLTSLMRGIYGFIFMYILVLLMNVIFLFLLNNSGQKRESISGTQTPDHPQSSDDSHRGTRIDLTTPDDSDPFMSGSQNEQEFVPWNQGTVRMNNMDPKQVARTITQFPDD